MSREPTREDWDKLPMSSEAQAALSRVIEKLLHGTPEETALARKEFSAFRARDMARYLEGTGKE